MYVMVFHYNGFRAEASKSWVFLIDLLGKMIPLLGKKKIAKYHQDTQY